MKQITTKKQQNHNTHLVLFSSVNSSQVSCHYSRIMLVAAAVGFELVRWYQRPKVNQKIKE